MASAEEKRKTHFAAFILKHTHSSEAFWFALSKAIQTLDISHEQCAQNFWVCC